jgi:hypothetical protein
VKSHCNAYTNRTANARGGTLSRGGHNDRKPFLFWRRSLRLLDRCGIELRLKRSQEIFDSDGVKCSSEPTVGLRRKSTVYGLNGHRLYYIMSLFKVTYKSTIQVSRNIHALITKTFENSDTAIDARLCLFHPRADEARVSPSSEQSLASAVNLAGLITSSPRHLWLSTPLLRDSEVFSAAPGSEL